MTTGDTTLKNKSALALAQDEYVAAKKELADAYNAYYQRNSLENKTRILKASVRVTAATLDIRAVRRSMFQNVCNKQVRS